MIIAISEELLFKLIEFAEYLECKKRTNLFIQRISIYIPKSGIYPIWQRKCY